MRKSLAALAITGTLGAGIAVGALPAVANAATSVVTSVSSETDTMLSSKCVMEHQVSTDYYEWNYSAHKYTRDAKPYHHTYNHRYCRS